MNSILSIFGLLLCLCLSSSYAEVCYRPGYMCVDKRFCRNGSIETGGITVIDRRSNALKTCTPQQECCYAGTQSKSEEDCVGAGKICVSENICIDGFIDIAGIKVINRQAKGKCSSDETCCTVKPKAESCTAGNACVPEQYCKDGVIDRTAGRGIILRSNGPCSNDQVCCAHAKERQCLDPQHVCVRKELCENGVIEKGGRRVINRQSSRPEACSGDMVCCSVTQTMQPPRRFNSIGCSKSRPVGGEFHGLARFDEFPWVVQIRERWYEENDSISFQPLSVGALVSPKAALTVAFKICNSSATDIIVRAGEWDERENIARYVDRYVKNMIIHDDFDYLRSYYDIAILILKEPFELNYHINTICLPQPNTDFVGADCVAAAWGKRQETDEHNSPILKKIQVRVLDRDTCVSKLRRAFDHPFFELHSSLTCAGGVTGNTCVGDIGAPLMCPVRGSNHYELAGILAYNSGCNDREAPGGYVNVTGVMPWISKYVRL